MSEIFESIISVFKNKQDEINEMRSKEILSRVKEAAGSSETVARYGKRLLKGTTVGVIVASILVGLTFSGAGEINADQTGTKYSQPPVVMDISDFGNATVDDDEDEAAQEKSRKIGFVARFKQAVLSLPQSVRLLIVTPLWLLGTGLLTLISFLWNVVFASPLAAVIMSFFAGFAVLVGLFAVTAKILFPEIPIRKILSGRNILILAISAAVMTLIDGVAPLFWHRYPFVAGVIKLGIGGLVVAMLAIKVRMVFYRDKYKNMPQAA